ncbi:hypothetical protein MXB_5604 [Myxobolus squamalis]|nr:hypothetical protein MXB_5604 [Myxobolus squamalis]
MLSPSNIHFSVRDSVIGQKAELFDQIENRMDPYYYADYFMQQQDRHDLFIVFEDLSELRRSISYINGTICRENSVGISEKNSPVQVASKILYGIGGVFGFEKIGRNQKCSCGFGRTKYCIMKEPIILK